MRVVSKIFDRFYKSGDIYLGHYEGWYCTPCEAFFTNTQVVDGKCPDCGRPVGQAREEAYFFRMSKYAPRLIEYIKSHPGFIEPVSREREMLNNFLCSAEGLQDLCVSRTSFKWGITSMGASTPYCRRRFSVTRGSSSARTKCPSRAAT